MSDVLWIDGRFTTTDEKVIAVEDRGFQFGDGVYEVMKLLHGAPLFVAKHFARMQSGLDQVEIPCPWTEAEFVALCRDLVARTSFPDGLIYVQVTRGESQRVHFWPEPVRPTALGYTRAYRFPDARRKKTGAAVITTPEIRWRLCNIKSTNLLANALAKKSAQRAGAEEVLFVDGGEVKEGASSSFFAVRDGRLITHPADPSILPGTVRDEVITLALKKKIRVDERPVYENELFSLDEAFLTSTSQAVLPIVSIDGRAVGSGRRGEITGTLQKLYDELEEREAKTRRR